MSSKIFRCDVCGQPAGEAHAGTQCVICYEGFIKLAPAPQRRSDVIVAPGLAPSRQPTQAPLPDVVDEPPVPPAGPNPWVFVFGAVAVLVCGVLGWSLHEANERAKFEQLRMAEIDAERERELAVAREEAQNAEREHERVAKEKAAAEAKQRTDLEQANSAKQAALDKASAAEARRKAAEEEARAAAEKEAALATEVDELSEELEDAYLAESELEQAQAALAEAERERDQLAEKWATEREQENFCVEKLPTRYTMQLASFKSLDSARATRDVLDPYFHGRRFPGPVFILARRTYFVVMAGAYDYEYEAAADQPEAEEILRGHGTVPPRYMPNWCEEIRTVAGEDYCFCLAPKH